MVYGHCWCVMSSSPPPWSSATAASHAHESERAGRDAAIEAGTGRHTVLRLPYTWQLPAGGVACGREMLGLLNCRLCTDGRCKTQFPVLVRQCACIHRLADASRRITLQSKHPPAAPLPWLGPARHTQVLTCHARMSANTMPSESLPPASFLRSRYTEVR
jgi:hypothetical protein